ncbi:MAG TPA: O-antigen ligase family protein [Thermoanaerobaculia bacterium]|nr:O-antigen ligase family protein [Thermoanaerobaculia bacterium]
MFLAMGIISEWKLGTLGLPSSGYRFMGTLHPEGQGFNCGMMFLASVANADVVKAPLSRLLFGSAAVGALTFLVFTGSRGPFAASLLAAGAYLLFTRKRVTVLQIALLALFVVLLFLLLYGAWQVIETLLLGRTEHISSLTGRVPLWIECWRFVARRPLTGYGYNGFWTQEHAWEFSESQDWVINSSHSMYVETALDLGLVGLALMLTMLLIACKSGLRNLRIRPAHTTAFYLALLTFMCTDGLLSNLVVAGGFVTFVFFCAIFYLCHSESFVLQNQCRSTPSKVRYQTLWHPPMMVTPRRSPFC